MTKRKTWYVVCCRVCLATNHRSCQDTDYLPKAAQRFRDGDKELDKNVKNKIGELQKSYRQHMTHAVQLRLRKKTMLKRLQLFKVSTTELIENLVTDAEKDIENSYDQVMRDKQTHIQNIGKHMSKLNALSEEFADEKDAALVYKKVLECKRILRENPIKPCLHDQNMTVNDKAVTQIAKAVETSMKDDRYNGVIGIAELCENIDVPNMCILTDGTLCLSHYNENKIIHIDTNLKEINNIDTENKVWGICGISKSDIAFTMPKLMKVQFLVLDGNPVLKSSFYTNIHCRGIAYCNDNMYVAGGGFSGEESGQINIFDLKGKLLHRFEHYSDGTSVKIPRSVIANTEHIYITDCQNGVICLDLHGKRHWILKNAKCEYPWGICFTPNANILIAGYISNNIAVVSKDGELLGELLDKNDGILSPKAVSIDIPNNRLLVTTSNGSILKVFDFEDCEI